MLPRFLPLILCLLTLIGPARAQTSTLHPTAGRSAAKVREAPKEPQEIRVADYLPLDADIGTGGGTDVTEELNALLSQSFDDDLLRRYVFDGVARTSDTIVAGGNSILEFRPGAGIFKTANSAGHLLTNRLSGGTVMVDGSLVIRGGIFNGNEANHSNRYEDNGNGSNDGGNSPWWKVGLWFAGLENLEMRGVEIRNAKTFALVLGGIEKTRIYDYRAVWTRNAGWTTNNWDGIHIWGDNPDTEIYNVYVLNGDDDALAINTDENAFMADDRRTTAAAPGSTNTGHIGRLLVDGFHFDRTYRGIRVYNTYGTLNASIGELVLRNFRGSIPGPDTGRYPASVFLYEGDVATERLEITNWNVLAQDNVWNQFPIQHVGTACLNNIHPDVRILIGAAEYTGNAYPTKSMKGAQTGPAGSRPAAASLDATGLGAAAIGATTPAAGVPIPP